MNRKSGKKHDFFKLFDKYTSATRRGKRVQKSGKRVKKDSLENYFYLRKLLAKFCEVEQFSLQIHSFTKISKRDFKSQQIYWKRFYQRFSDFLYEKENCYDNYVGASIKMLRTFFNYLNDELGLNVGSFHKNFYAPHEEIQIVTLTPERLNFLIYNKEFENSLSDKLKRVKDLFVFGCTVALRVSDLLILKPSNIERTKFFDPVSQQVKDRAYLKVVSKKTETFTRVWLPDYIISILNKYSGRKNRILPYYHKNILGKFIKELAEKAEWTEPCEKSRHRRGVPIVIYRDPAKKMHYRFCDLVSTHTMRRTAVTTMLCLGMKEEAVRKISGHAPGSKEFYRYVSFAQSYLDTEVELMHQKRDEKQLAFA